MSTLDGDGLRANERAMLDRALAGEPLPAADTAMILQRLGNGRQQPRITCDDDAVAWAFNQLLDGFVIAVREADAVRALNQHLEIQRNADQAKRLATSKHLHEARRDLHALTRELTRVKAERDELRQAARDADGQRLALQRRIADGV